MSVRETNANTWSHRRFVSQYRGSELRPAESRILERYASPFARRILELGCGTGRVTGHLARRSGDVEAVDLSAAMVAEARRRHPEVAFRVMDMADLSGFEPGSLDAVIATCNVIDVLDDVSRRALLVDVRRLLADDGVFVFSSHNRDRVGKLKQPWQLPTHSLASFAKAVVYLPLRMRNRHRLRHLSVREPDYEIVNDSAHDWRLLQYYIHPADQRLQLRDCRFEMLECVTLGGRSIADGEVVEDPELYYVARRV